jgi:hypothetical protein
MSDGDWVEGPPQWWWKYVFPARGQFWLSILAAKLAVMDPTPDPWFQRAAADILEGLVMLHAAATVADREVSTQLQKEAAEKINQAVQTIG